LLSNIYCVSKNWTGKFGDNSVKSYIKFAKFFHYYKQTEICKRYDTAILAHLKSVAAIPCIKLQK